MADGEDDKTRVDRELIELLNELRVALPGVQVLFAFLLVIPFNQRFERLGRFETKVYLFAVVVTALSSILLISPAAQHRVRFRRVDKTQLLTVGTGLAIAGLALLAAGVAASVHLVTTMIHGGRAAGAVAAAIATAATGVWFVLPLAYRGSPYDEHQR